jgi:hypothetical protein
MPLQSRPRPPSVVASTLAAAGIVLAVAGCSGITPLGPDAPVTMPPPRHLGSPIVLQVMRVQPPNSTGGCPAGWAAVSVPAGGGPSVTAGAVPVGRPRRVVPRGASASPAPPPPAASPAPPPPAASPAPPQPSAAFAPTPCYRPAGTPVTITSAAVSSVFTYRPPPGEAKGPDLYGFIVAVPGADVTAVTAVIRQAYDTGNVVGISVGGKLWQAPQVRTPFPGQHLQITLLSRNQALQLHRILIPSG